MNKIFQETLILVFDVIVQLPKKHTFEIRNFFHILAQLWNVREKKRLIFFSDLFTYQKKYFSNLATIHDGEDFSDSSEFWYIFLILYRTNTN